MNIQCNEVGSIENSCIISLSGQSQRADVSVTYNVSIHPPTGVYSSINIRHFKKATVS